MSSLGERTKISKESPANSTTFQLPPPDRSILKKKVGAASSSSKHSTKRRLKPFSFPDPKSLNLHSLTLISFEEKCKQHKSVQFPSNVLMQQAITDGEVQEMKQLMKEHGCHVINDPEPSGLSPAMRCVFEAQLAPLRLLVEAGADLTARDDENWTALHVAASMDDMEAAKLILEHCKQGLTQLCNDDGERPIDLAESTEMARLLLEADLAQNKNSASVKSKSNKDELAILQLVQDHFERRGNVHELDRALKIGTNYDSLLHMAARKNYPHLASYLLRHTHCELDCRDRRLLTPLHIAALYHSRDIALLLIDFGASVTSLTAAMEVAFDLTQDEVIRTALREQEGGVYL